MNNLSKTLITTAAAAAAALGLAGSANAQVMSGFREAARTGAIHPDYYPDHYAYNDAQRWDEGRPYACGAPRWDPQVRYMPGQVVRRHGELYMARGVSARVYNVNSPPEWTPNYWVPARCQ